MVAQRHFRNRGVSALSLTDNEVTAAMLGAAFEEAQPGHIHARRIIRREHFKILYARNPSDVLINPEAGSAVFEAANRKFGEGLFRHDRYQQSSGAQDFPVRMRDDRIVSSLSVSETLNRLPVLSVDYVFADRSIAPTANEWVIRERANLIKPEEEAESNG